MNLNIYFINKLLLCNQKPFKKLFKQLNNIYKYSDKIKTV